MADLYIILPILLFVLGAVVKRGENKKFEKKPYSAKSILKKKGLDYSPAKLPAIRIPGSRTPDVSVGKGGGGSLREFSVFLEDRNNDWLAKQLREEQRILRRGDQMDLGASHYAECDARALKLGHLLVHSDAVDNGEV